MHLNTYVKYLEQRYEIYWTTKSALHVLQNYVSDLNAGAHVGLDHSRVSQVVRKAMYILPLPKESDPYLHVCLTKLRGIVYETYAYLVPELDFRPPRCVIITCYKSNKAKYQELFDTPLYPYGTPD